MIIFSITIILIAMTLVIITFIVIRDYILMFKIILKWIKSKLKKHY